MNIMFNFVPNESVTCDDRDPHWMNRYIKILIAAINDFHKKICFTFQQYWQSFNI